MLNASAIDVLGLSEVAAMLEWPKSKITTYVRRGTFPAADKKLASGSLWLRATIENYQAERDAAKRSRESKKNRSKKDIWVELAHAQAALVQQKKEFADKLAELESTITQVKDDLAKDNSRLSLLAASDKGHVSMEDLIAKTVAALAPDDTPPQKLGSAQSPTIIKSTLTQDDAVKQITSHAQVAQRPAQTRNASVAQTQSPRNNLAEQHSTNATEETSITVLAAETTQAGTFKAICLTTAGTKLTVYANNENKIKLQQAAGTGKNLLLKIRALEHGLFAVSVRAA
jgi:predicted DNA-binding transcriptional regulator AlpA